jgi:hypothetical protein
MKLKTVAFYRKSSYLLMLGVVHAALTPVFYKSLTVDSLWFFGTGMSLIFLSLLNIAASKILDPWLLRVALAATLMGTAYSIALTYVLKEPQAYLGLLFHLTVLISCYATYRKMGIPRD